MKVREETYNSIIWILIFIIFVLISIMIGTNNRYKQSIEQQKSYKIQIEDLEQQVNELQKEIELKNNNITELTDKNETLIDENEILEKQLAEKTKEEEPKEPTELENKLISESPMKSINGMNLNDIVIYNGKETYYTSGSFFDEHMLPGKDKYYLGIKDIAGHGTQEMYAIPTIDNEYRLVFLAPHSTQEEIICMLSDGYRLYLVPSGSIENK